MELIEEIKANWRRDILNKFQEIKSLKTPYLAWTIKTWEGYGVAVLYEGEEVREDFANAMICCDKINLNDQKRQVLVLLSKSSIEEDSAFVNLCFDFVNPGENGEYRNELLKSPVKWWASWKGLLGNKSVDERIYDVIGELCVLKYYAEKGANPKWTGPNQSSYDVETDKFFVEVKSSVSRSKKEITISSIYQLSNLNKELFLTFCTFEPAVNHGESINSLVDNLKDLGYNVSFLNESLEKKGLGLGKSDRNKKFILHSMYQYIVDDRFPKIVEQSFVNGVLPTGIVDISYTVDLSGLNAINLME